MQRFSVYSTAKQSNHLNLWTELKFQSKTFTLFNLMNVIHVYAQSHWWYESDSNVFIVSSLLPQINNCSLSVFFFFLLDLYIYISSKCVWMDLSAVYALHLWICAHFTEAYHFHRFSKGISFIDIVNFTHFNWTKTWLRPLFVERKLVHRCFFFALPHSMGVLKKNALQHSTWKQFEKPQIEMQARWYTFAHHMQIAVPLMDGADTENWPVYFQCL